MPSLTPSERGQFCALGLPMATGGSSIIEIRNHNLLIIGLQECFWSHEAGSYVVMIHFLIFL